MERYKLLLLQYLYRSRISGDYIYHKNVLRTLNVYRKMGFKEETIKWISVLERLTRNKDSEKKLNNIDVNKLILR